MIGNELPDEPDVGIGHHPAAMREDFFHAPEASRNEIGTQILFAIFSRRRTDAPPRRSRLRSVRIARGQEHLQFVRFQELRYV